MSKFKVGQLLVCDEKTLGVIQGIYCLTEDNCSYYVDFSDDEINKNFHNALWPEDDVENWYYNYIDILMENKNV